MQGTAASSNIHIDTFYALAQCSVTENELGVLERYVNDPVLQKYTYFVYSAEAQIFAYAFKAHKSLVHLRILVSVHCHTYFINLVPNTLVSNVIFFVQFP